ncbi:MAG: hybrid sensor histidine kinase/response regulator [Thermoflexales bacterium]|nr:hybrid sensor histidine kinase/response regulator [Thermoflexales bacterium]
MTHEKSHILVVDDSQTSRLALALSLEEQGYEIAMAEDGQQALDMLAAEAFDLVLLDIVMPDMDGYQVLAQMKSDPRLRNIPVIVISAMEEVDCVVRCIEMGAEDHLPKQHDSVLLKARIGASLEKKRLHDQEVEYLQQVSCLTDAAMAVENHDFEAGRLAGVSARADALGTLARVFQRMVSEFYTRERQLEQDNRVKTAFIDVINHELRSPFVSAAFSVELLQRYAQEKMFDELQAQIQQLDKELSEGRRLIEVLIAFAAQVGKDVNLRRQETDFSALIRDTTFALETVAESRGITISYNLAPHMPALVDRERMSDAIHHLVYNAIKFNREGGLVRIDCWPADQHIVFRVKDNGVGIPPEKLDTLWDAFAQTAERLKRGVEGLGLGLALVKSAVEAHGGEVMATSEQGQGSTFGFRIPI